MEDGFCHQCRLPFGEMAEYQKAIERSIFLDYAVEVSGSRLEDRQSIQSNKVLGRWFTGV